MVSTHRKPADYFLLAYVAVLIIFGLIMLTSASAPFAKERFGDSYFFIKRQLLYGVLPGTILLIFFAKISYHNLKKLSIWIFGACIILLCLVLIPGIGSNFGKGAQSWIVLFGLSFQPAEVAKIALIVYLSSFLAALGSKIEDFKTGFLPVLLVAGIPIFLIVLQPDVGTVSILFVLIFGLLFLAGARVSHLGVLALSGVAALVVLVKIAPYRIARLTTFLHPELDPQGIGYHINQAFLAIGSGGFLGLGFGRSRQKFQYLPEVHADSIFAIIAEEMGFLVIVLFLLLLLLICYRGFFIAKRAPDPYGRLVAGGVVILIMAQALLNIGAIVGLLPLTGVPLPFVSHGGTSLMIFMASIGILLNVSKEINI